MGISIHYEGTSASPECLYEIIDRVKIFSAKNNWSIDEINDTKIVVTPHAKCESLSFIFNDKSKFSGCTKTGFAPAEIHEQVVNLFYEIKPYCKSLKIVDESGYWDAFLDIRNNKPIREITKFPVVTENDLIKETLLLPNYSIKSDYDFWESDPIFVKPVVLHLPTIRNKMSFDLTNGSGSAFVSQDIINGLSSNDFFIYDQSWYDDHCNYIVDLSTLWAWKMSGGNPTKIKRNKCIAFGYAIGKGCFGLENGFFNKTHRDAWIALDILEQEETLPSPIRSLGILYALFDFCGFKKLS